MIYQFEKQLALGEAGEKKLDSYFRRYFQIYPVSRDGQRAGMDRIFVRCHRADSTIFRGEYKTDYKAVQTGNAFIETVSVDTAHKLGWAYTSQAQILIYYVPGLAAFYVVSMENLQQKLVHWKRRYPVGAGWNEGYKSQGLLVPLRELHSIAITRNDYGKLLLDIDWGHVLLPIADPENMLSNADAIEIRENAYREAGLLDG